MFKCFYMPSALVLPGLPAAIYLLPSIFIGNVIQQHRIVLFYISVL